MRRSDFDAAVAGVTHIEFQWADKHSPIVSGSIDERFPDGPLLVETTSRFVVLRPRDVSMIRPARGGHL